MSITGMAAATVNDILYNLGEWGFFSYVLPALLIFAVVYGILAKSNIFGQNKGVNAIVAGAVAFLSLQFDVVPEFFSTIFPYAGVGISILLVALILMGLFGIGADGKFSKIFFWIGGIITIGIVIASLTNFEAWQGGYWWDEYSPTIITLLIIGIIVAVIVVPKGGGDEEKKPKVP